jgi:2-methylcitrate dehydratase PrpD
MDVHTQTRSITETVADWIASATIPPACEATAHRLVLDVAGLCVAARNESYVKAVLASTEPGGACTAIGHPGDFNAYDAALVNGTAAHGEDYDDTFEGGPIHSGAVVVPAVLALAERERLPGAAALRGIVIGAELMCRLSLVAPKAIHKAGFHPTASPYCKRDRHRRQHGLRHHRIPR